MKLGRVLGALLFCATALPIGTVATHDDGCVPGAADPSTYSAIDLTGLGGDLYYLEERGNPFGTAPPVPLSGFLFGDHTWMYAEVNGLPGMQRGTYDVWVMEDACFPPPPPGFPPCWMFMNGDPLDDEHCGHGPDSFVLGTSLWMPGAP